MDQGEASGDKNVEQNYLASEEDPNEEINNFKIQAAGKNAQVFTKLNNFFSLKNKNVLAVMNTFMFSNRLFLSG